MTNPYSSVKKGQVVMVEKTEGHRLVKAGLAEPVKETATKRPPEKR